MFDKKKKKSEKSEKKRNLVKNSTHLIGFNGALAAPRDLHHWYTTILCAQLSWRTSAAIMRYMQGISITLSWAHRTGHLKS